MQERGGHAKRKIYKQIEDFYKCHSNKALMITGAQTGRKSSYIIENMLKSTIHHLFCIDF